MPRVETMRPPKTMPRPSVWPTVRTPKIFLGWDEPVACSVSASTVGVGV